MTKKKKNKNPIEKKTINEQFAACLEALIFASPKALTTRRIKQLLSLSDYPLEELNDTLGWLIAKYSTGGILLEKVSGGFQFRTQADFSDHVKKLVDEKPARLSKSALEVLTIVSYKQPVTRADIDSIRGVDSGHLMRGLMDKNLVRTNGHAETVGRPLLYITTPYFLEVFGLNTLEDLPELADMVNELSPTNEGSDQEITQTVLNALPGEELAEFFDKSSPLSANPDRGDFDQIEDEEIHQADFGVEERAKEEIEEQT